MKDKNISTAAAVAAGQNVKERDYWLNKLSGPLVKSSFPSIGKKQPDKRSNTVDTGRVTFTLSGELFARLMKLRNGSEPRLHMILTAGLVELLHRYTGNSDIIIGAPIYKQKVAGTFINSILVLRNQLEEGLTFKDVLLRVRQTIVEASENQNYPIETLLYKLNMSFDITNFPLFDVVSLLENVHDRAYLKPLKPKMIFLFNRTEDTVRCTLEYDVSSYGFGTVERIAGHYRNLLEGALFNLHLPASGIDILEDHEKRQLLYDFNNLKEEIPAAGNKTIHLWFQEQVEKTPDSIALVYYREQLTYRELNRRSNRLAHLLREKGVGTDTVVGLMVERAFETVISILAVLKAGGAYVPIGPEFPEKRVLSMLKDSSVSLVLTREKELGNFSVISLKNINPHGPEPVVTPARSPITDFDSLPKPDRTLVNYENYHKHIGIAMVKHTVSIQATRGCPFNCAFCHKIWPKKHVVRSAGNIFQEVLQCHSAGLRRFVFIDDVFNLDRKNIVRFFEKIIRELPDVQLFFPNGLRGDILDKELIDLMVRAGTVNIDLALESASPRIQKLIRKNLDLEKFKENVIYITENYPRVLLEMELMVGFPTETEEEVLMTLDFLNQLKWVHFPNLNILKIYPNTDMARLAVENGISEETIEGSASLAYHELPDTLPFSKAFVRQLQARFTNEYFLSKERLLHVLPFQLETMTEDELVQKYDSYLPADIKHFPDILQLADISMDQLGENRLLPAHSKAAPGFTEKIASYFPKEEKTAAAGGLKILLLDLSQLFARDGENMLYDMVEEPLGLMYLMTYLKEKLGNRVTGKIAKSRADFDGFDELKTLIADFAPDIIGIRTLSYYRDFFHKTVLLIRQWGITVPIIAGGPYATSDYNVLLKDPNVDLAVLGEGELTVVELVEKIIQNHKKLPAEDVLSGIHGIAFIKDRDKPRIRRSCRRVLLVDQLPPVPAPVSLQNPDYQNNAGDLVYVIYTSGSTGKPKGVMLEHRNLVNLLEYQFKHTNIDNTKIMQFATISFDVSFHEIFSALLSGGALVIVDKETRTDIPALFSLLEKNQVKTVFLPMSFLKLIFSEENYINCFPRSIDHIQTAGEQVVVSDRFRRYLKENNIHLHNHYGPAETHVVTALTLPPSGDIPGLPPIGESILNTDIYILDRHMRPVPLGVAGELYIGGIQVGRGYLGNPRATAEKFIPNPFTSPLSPTLYRTGDLARWLPDGNVDFLGRIDFQLKIRGFRVEPGEIESRLANHDRIKEAVVIPKEDKDGDKYLCAYIVAPGELDAAEIRDYLSQKLPDFMIPAYFVHMDKIPVTHNEKVDRRALPEPQKEEGAESGTYAAPRNEIEQKLAEIWKEVLGVDRVGINDNFFNIGGHSLKVLKLINSVHKEFDTRINFQSIFKFPTIALLQDVIRESKTTHHERIEIQAEKEYYPLSYAQERLWLLYKLDPRSPAFNMVGKLILDEPVDETIIRDVFDILLKRHDGFRTCFKEIDFCPVQIIQPANPLNLEIIDLSHLDESGAEEKSRQLLRDESTVPFNLEIAPLLRAKLVKCNEEMFDLILALHHIIFDGWSMEILEREFLSIYESQKKGNAPELEPLRIQYKDYAAWHNQILADESKMRTARDFWKDQLFDNPVLFGLPYDFPKKDMDGKDSAEFRIVIPGEIVDKLRALARENNASLFMVLLAGFNLFLSRITAETDIILSVPGAARQHEDLKNIIGFFVNTLILRNRVNPTESFIDFLGNVQENTLQVLEYQGYPLELICSELKIKYPDISVFFNMSIFGTKDREILENGDTYHVEEVQNAKYDMVCYLTEYKNCIVINTHYYKKLFKPDTIERLMRLFLKILEKIADDPGKRVSKYITPERKLGVKLNPLR